MAALRTRDHCLRGPLVSAILAFVSRRRGIAHGARSPCGPHYDLEAVKKFVSGHWLDGTGQVVRQVFRRTEWLPKGDVAGNPGIERLGNRYRRAWRSVRFADRLVFATHPSCLRLGRILLAPRIMRLRTRADPFSTVRSFRSRWLDPVIDRDRRAFDFRALRGGRHRFQPNTDTLSYICAESH
jgi:hypothetical protein